MLILMGTEEYPKAYGHNIFFLLQYVFSRSDDDSKSSVTIKILDKQARTWYCASSFQLCSHLHHTFWLVTIHTNHRSYGRVVPTVLEKQPTLTKSMSAIPVNDDKILIVEKGVPLIDTFWFLEVNTSLLIPSVVNSSSWER
jgi:guanylate kinase